MRTYLPAGVALLSLAAAAVSPARAQSYSIQSMDDRQDTGDNGPTPGSVTVRLNGRVRFYADYLPQAQSAQSSPIAASNAPGAANGNTSNGAGSNKVANYGFQTYLRLYPGMDGVASNGLRYGAAAEIRTGSGNAANRSGGQSIGAAGGGTAGSIDSQVAGRSTLFLRRAYGYVGMNDYGVLRLGETDGPTSLYETGTFENFADGGFNGDMTQEQPVFQQLVWPFSVVGNEYGTMKAVYLSPQWHGVDGGVSFEPNTGSASTGIGQGATGCGQVGGATIGCDQLAASPTYESMRRRNTGEILLRYRGTFGPVGLAATGAYIASGHVADNGAPARPVQFEGLSLADGGLVATYGGLAVGGHVMAGAGSNLDGPMTLQKRGGKGELAWLLGASYTLGPVILGASYVDVTSDGDVGDLTTGTDRTGQRREQGVALGSTYAVAPGFAVFTEALWDQRKEGGHDFLDNTQDQSHNKVTGQVIGLGTSFAW